MKSIAGVVNIRTTNQFSASTVIIVPCMFTVKNVISSLRIASSTVYSMIISWRMTRIK